MMAEVKQEKAELTTELEALNKQLKRMEPEGSEFRKLY